jgi:hypothetical protein
MHLDALMRFSIALFCLCTFSSTFVVAQEEREMEIDKLEHVSMIIIKGVVDG